MTATTTEKMLVEFRVWPREGVPRIVCFFGDVGVEVRTLSEARELAERQGYEGIRVEAV